MYTLANESLAVEILDPVADQDRFGTRYCTGGYIFQVTDARLGPLLTGPTYPDSFNWFDGQGIPDGFNLSPLREPTSTSTEALVVGVGMCDLEANRVLEFCHWDVQQHGASITMRTEQRFQDFALELERSVSVRGRTVRSTNHLRNSGPRPIPIRWFPHPFYPQTATDELCRLSFPVQFPDNDHYVIAESGFISRKGWPWQAGHYLPLDHNATGNLVIFQRHPLLGLVGATCSYVPALFPIWGNQHTFSWEPFFERTVSAGQAAEWWIDYDF